MKMKTCLARFKVLLQLRQKRGQNDIKPYSVVRAHVLLHLFLGDHGPVCGACFSDLVNPRLVAVPSLATSM